MKRIISMTLAVIMIFGTLVGCGDKNGGKSGDKKTLTVGLPQASTVTEYDDNAFTKYIEEALDIDIEFVLFSNASEAMNQLSLMCAAGDELPDVLVGFSNMSSLMMYQYGEDGFFIDIKDLIEEYGEEFNSHMDQLPEEEKERVMNYITHPETGAIYGLPTYSSVTISDYLQQQMMINQTWLDAVGMQKPTNVEELYNVLKAFKEEDPNGNGREDEFPMLSASIYRYIINAFVYYDSDYPLNITDGKVWSPVITNEYRESLKYLRKIYEEGLIKFSVNASDAKNSISGDGTDALVGIWSGNPMSDINHSSQVLDQYVVLEPLADATGKGGYIVERQKDLLLTGFITKDCENTELAMRFLDFCYNDEAVTRRRHGEIGVNWEYAEEAQPSMFGTQSTIRVLNSDLFTAGNATWGSFLPNIYTNENYLTIASTEPGIDAETARILNGQTELMETWRQPEEKAFSLGFTLDEQTTLDSIGGTISTTITEYFSLFITNELDPSNDADWKEYLDKMEASGLSKQIKIYQTAYDRKN